MKIGKYYIKFTHQSQIIIEIKINFIIVIDNIVSLAATKKVDTLYCILKTENRILDTRYWILVEW